MYLEESEGGWLKGNAEPPLTLKGACVKGAQVWGSSSELTLTGLVDRSDGVGAGKKENGSKAFYGATRWLVVLLSAYPLSGLD